MWFFFAGFFWRLWENSQVNSVDTSQKQISIIKVFPCEIYGYHRFSNWTLFSLFIYLFIYLFFISEFAQVLQETKGVNK